MRSKPLYKELNSHGTVAQQAAEAAQYARSWHDSLVDDLFGGQLQSTITCSACSHASHCFDPFLDLSVPIPKNKQVSLQVRLCGAALLFAVGCICCMASMFNAGKMAKQGMSDVVTTCACCQDCWVASAPEV